MINIGIVGAGGMGTVHHSNYRHLDGCAVVGVVDPSPAGRERAAQWGVPCYESITDMVEAGGVDGCTKEHTETVDHLSLAVHLSVLRSVSQALTAQMEENSQASVFFSSVSARPVQA